MNYLISILFTVFIVLNVNILYAQSYSKKEIRSTIKKTYYAIKNINSLVYTLDYHFKPSSSLDTLYKKCIASIKINDTKKDLPIFNIEIYYDNNEIKKAIYNGHLVLIKYSDSNSIKNRVINTEKEGTSSISGSDIYGLLFNKIFNPKHIKKINSIVGKLLIEDIRMTDTVFEGKSCYKIIIYPKNRKSITFVKDAVNVYIIEKKNYLPIVYQFTGEIEGLKLYDLYKIKYNKINSALNDSLFKIAYTENKKNNILKTNKNLMRIDLDNISYMPIPLFNNDNFTLSEHKGKIIILDFWYRSCLPCLKLMPNVNKLHETYKDDDVLIIGINDINDKASVKGYFKLKGYNYLSSYKNESNLAKILGINQFPTTIIIGKDGRIIEKIIGYEKDYYKKVSKVIENETEK